MESTFLAHLKAGKVTIDDVDDWVEQWHHNETSSRTLPNFLGFDDDDYSLFLFLDSDKFENHLREKYSF